MAASKNDVLKYLPHREPFLFVDEVLTLNKGSDIHAIKRLSGDEDYLKGHFPNNPVMPGVIIIEALAQASGILGFQTMNKNIHENLVPKRTQLVGQIVRLDTRLEDVKSVK